MNCSAVCLCSFQVECSSIVQHAEQIVKANGFADGKYDCTLLTVNRLSIVCFDVIVVIVMAIKSGSIACDGRCPTGSRIQQICVVLVHYCNVCELP